MVNDYEVIVGAPEPPPPYLQKDYNHDNLLHEIAIHEASHFVFSILLEALKFNFTQVKYIIIQPEINNNVQKISPKGLVHGFGPPLAHHVLTGYNMEELKEWYLQDCKRLFGTMLKSIAGYTSNRVFSKEDTYFISLPDNNLRNVNYYTLKTAPESISDISIIKERSNIINISSNKEKLDLLQELSDSAKKITDNYSVKKAIKITASALLKNPGKKIEGKELEKLKSTLKHVLKGISLLPVLYEFEKKYCNNTHKI